MSATNENVHRTIREVQKAKLHQQTHFKISMSWVPSELPDELLDWPELQRLEMEMYSGPLAGLKRLPALTTLTLSGGALARDLAEVTQLQELRFTHGSLKEVPQVADCVQLATLRLTLYKCLETFPDLSRLTALRELSVDAHAAKELPETFGALRSLQKLQLFMQGIARLPASFAQLEKLQALRISTDVRAPLDAVIGSLSALEDLALLNDGPDFEYVRFPLPESLSGLVQLRTYYSLRHMDESPAFLWKLPLIESVDIRNCSKISEFPVGCTLKKLALFGPFGDLPQSIKNCTQLESLQLSSSQIATRPAVLDELKIEIKEEHNVYQHVAVVHEEEEEGQAEEELAQFWIHGVSCKGETFLLDVEKVIATLDYPDTERQTWALQGERLSCEGVTAERAMQYDCGYHREHFTNTLDPPNDGKGLIMPGDPKCLESPVGALRRQHSYKSDLIDVLVVNDDEAYVLCKVSWIDHVYMLLHGTSGGRVWRVLERREHEMLSSIARYRGDVIVGSSEGVYKIVNERMESFLMGAPAPLLLVDGDRLVFGGGTSSALFIAEKGEVVRGLALSFKESSVAQKPFAPARDEAWAIAELRRGGYLDENFALTRLPSPFLVESTPEWHRAIAGDTAAAETLRKEHPSALTYRLHADLTGLLASCDAYLRLRPFDLAMHDKKISLLTDAVAIDAAKKRRIDVKDSLSVLTFADSWLNRGGNFENVEKRLMESLAILPDVAPLYRSMAQLRLQQGRFDEVELLLQQADALEPDVDRSTHQRALLAFAKHDYQASRRLYEKLSPEYMARTPMAAFNLALLSPPDHDQVIEDMTRIIATAPELSAPHNSRAYALFLLGEREVALRDASCAVRFDRNNGPAWTTKAAIEVAIGDEEAALASCAQAIEAGLSLDSLLGDKDLARIHAKLRQ